MHSKYRGPEVGMSLAQGTEGKPGGGAWPYLELHLTLGQDDIGER